MVKHASFALALAVSIALFAGAAALQQETLGIMQEKVGKLIDVQGNLSFPQLIPGYNYSSEITVSWAVPAEAIAGIKDQVVIVYAHVRPASKDSWITIEADGKKRKEMTFMLTCNAAGGECGPGSVLSKTFSAVTRAPASVAYPHSDVLVVEASFAAFPPTEEEALETELLNQSGSVEAAIEAAGATADQGKVAEAQELVVNAAQLVAGGDFDAARALLAQANETLQKAVATPTPVPTATPAPAPSIVSGFFSGRNLPYIIGLVVLALVVVSFFFTRRTEGIDLDKVMADEDRGLLEKEGGKSDLGPLGKDDRGRAGYSAAKPGEPGYSPKTNYLDRYKDKE